MTTPEQSTYTPRSELARMAQRRRHDDDSDADIERQMRAADTLIDSLEEGYGNFTVALLEAVDAMGWTLE